MKLFICNKWRELHEYRGQFLFLCSWYFKNIEAKKRGGAKIVQNKYMGKNKNLI
jgi:hypothetical protein